MQWTDLLTQILKFPLTCDREGQTFSAAAGEPVGGHAVEALDQAAESAHAICSVIEIKGEVRLGVHSVDLSDT